MRFDTIWADWCQSAPADVDPLQPNPSTRRDLVGYFQSETVVRAVVSVGKYSALCKAFHKTENPPLRQTSMNWLPVGEILDFLRDMHAVSTRCFMRGNRSIHHRYMRLYGGWPMGAVQPLRSLGHFGNGQTPALGSVVWTIVAGPRHPHDVRRPLLT
jgi:hypothetical protein